MFSQMEGMCDGNFNYQMWEDSAYCGQEVLNCVKESSEAQVVKEAGKRASLGLFLSFLDFSRDQLFEVPALTSQWWSAEVNPSSLFVFLFVCLCVSQCKDGGQRTIS